MSKPLRGVALRLHGPLQAWGGSVIGDRRPTLPFPTRSAVLGLVAGCMGIRRTENERLLKLARDARVHVRVDAPGTPIVDDQTIQGNPNASPTRQTIQSKRTYLCDASFTVVVVPNNDTPLQVIANALRLPTFSPFLGRRTCVPSTRLLLESEVNAADEIALFETLAPGPQCLLEQLHSQRSGAHSRAADKRVQEVDFYLDVEDHPEKLRRIPVRDDFAGPLPRQWCERFAVHVRRPINPLAILLEDPPCT